MAGLKALGCESPGVRCKMTDFFVCIERQPWILDIVLGIANETKSANQTIVSQIN